jgi:hypothetical protein
MNLSIRVNARKSQRCDDEREPSLLRDRVNLSEASEGKLLDAESVQLLARPRIPREGVRQPQDAAKCERPSRRIFTLTQDRVGPLR